MRTWTCQSCSVRAAWWATPPCSRPTGTVVISPRRSQMINWKKLLMEQFLWEMQALKPEISLLYKQRDQSALPRLQRRRGLGQGRGDVAAQGAWHLYNVVGAPISMPYPSSVELKLISLSASTMWPRHRKVYELANSFMSTVISCTAYRSTTSSSRTKSCSRRSVRSPGLESDQKISKLNNLQKWMMFQLKVIQVSIYDYIFLFNVTSNMYFNKKKM